MADLEFVNPSTGAVLGAYAYGTIAAGVESTAYPVRLRYRWGQSGSGLYQNALILEVSEDGGSTWRTDLAEFTLQVTAVTNTPNDPLFLGAATSERRTTRLDLPALRAGCAYDISVTFAPTLRTGTATSAYSWRLGVVYNESFRAIDIVPDAPTGVLTGLGDETISEWITVPTLTLGTGEVTLGAGTYVHEGAPVSHAGGAVTLNQTGYSGNLTSGQEYTALLSLGAAGTVTTTKGVRALAGASVAPAYPVGELPYAVVIVPYGGVIVTGTVVAVAGRLLPSDGGGLVVTVQPGRATMPGYLLTPRTVQSITLPDDATSIVYLDSQGVPSLVDGVQLATVTTAGGDITGLVDDRLLLYQGQRPKLFAGLDADGFTITDPVLSGASGTLGGALNANGNAINGLPLYTWATPETDAATHGEVISKPVKTRCRLAASVPVTWPSVVTNGDFATVLTPWTGTNWAQSAGTALHTAGATDPLTYSVTIVDAVTYRITVTVTGAAGTVTPLIGADAGTPIAAGAGVSTQLILATAGGALSVSFEPTTDFDGALDDILVETTFYGLPDDIDSVAVADTNRVLLAGEVDTSTNGKWIVNAALPWTRHPDCLDAYYVFEGISLWITEGTAHTASEWVQYGTFAAQTWAKKYQVP